MQSYETLFCLQNNISKQHLPKVPKLLIRQVSNNSAHVFCKKKLQLLAEEKDKKNSCWHTSPKLCYFVLREIKGYRASLYFSENKITKF